MNPVMQEILTAPIGEKVFVAAHRGRFGGNIIENTLEAFQNAMNAGADIVETDVTRTSDDRLVLFHDSTVDRLTTGAGESTSFTEKEFLDLGLKNAIGEISGSRMNTLDEFLAFMKGRKVINLDKCRDYMDEAYEFVLKYDMEDQLLLKNPVPCTKDIEWLRRTGYHPLYVPVVRNEDEIPGLYEVLRQIDVKVVEVFFSSEDSGTISREFIEDLHARGIRVFANAMRLAGQFSLCAFRDDNRSLLENPDEGWGWLADRGIDIIQTDWTRECCEYLASTGRR